MTGLALWMSSLRPRLLPLGLLRSSLQARRESYREAMTDCFVCGIYPPRSSQPHRPRLMEGTVRPSKPLSSSRRIRLCRLALIAPFDSGSTMKAMMDSQERSLRRLSSTDTNLVSTRWLCMPLEPYSLRLVRPQHWLLVDKEVRCPSCPRESSSICCVTELEAQKGELVRQHPAAWPACAVVFPHCASVSCHV